MTNDAQRPVTLFIYKLILFMSKLISTELLHSAASIQACPVVENAAGLLAAFARQRIGIDAFAWRKFVCNQPLQLELAPPDEIKKQRIDTRTTSL